MMPTREQWVAYYLQGTPIPGWTVPLAGSPAPTPGSAEEQSALIAFGIQQMKQHQG